MDYTKKVIEAKKQTPVVVILLRRIEEEVPFLKVNGENATVLIGEAKLTRISRRDLFKFHVSDCEGRSG